MLYAQIIAFILIMVVFDTYHPAQPAFTALQSLAASLGAVLWLGVICRLMVRRLINRMRRGVPMEAAKKASALQFQMHGAAIGIFAFCVIFLDLKYHLGRWLPLEASETITGLCALALYTLILSLVWWAAWPLEAEISRRAESPGEFIRAQLRHVAPVIFPWLMVSAISDLVALAIPGGRAFLASEAGDWLFLGAFLVIMALAFPPLVRYWWGCKPLGFGETRRVASEVLAYSGVKVAEILTWPLWRGKALTAGILGLAPRWRYLLITPALADALSPDEMAAVVAHEAGHVRHRHIPLYIALFMGFFLAFFALNAPLRTLLAYVIMQIAGTGWGADWLLGESDNGLVGLALALPMLLALVLYIRFVLGWFMRNFERQADFFALRTMGTARHIIASLESIAILSGGTRDVPSGWRPCTGRMPTTGW